MICDFFACRLVDSEKSAGLRKNLVHFVRFSGHYDDNAASDWIFSLASESRNRRAELSPEPIEITETQSRLWSLSSQHLRRFGPVQLTLGFENLRERDYSPLEMAEVTEIGQSAYVYGQWQPDRTGIAVTVGLSAEHFRLENPFFTNRIERHRVSPKLGIVWTPTPNTTVRAAAFSSVKRPLVASWTLEPTQLAGFNQFFTGFESFYGDPDGTVSKRAGIGVDQRLGRWRAPSG